MPPVSIKTSSFTDSVRALHTAQKSNRGAPLYSRFINRPLGRLFAAAAFQLALTPNHVTAISALLTFSGIASLALWPPSVLMAVAVGILLICGYAMDSADGQLARLRGGGTQAGEWLDHVCDGAKLATIHLAVLVSFYRFGEFGTDVVLVVPLVYSAVDSLWFFAFILTDRMRKSGPPALAVGDGVRPSVLRSLLSAPTDYGLLCVVFLTFAYSQVFTVLYGLMLLGTAGHLALALPKWYRDIIRLGC
jgi:CDP-diacylglycerol--serine O-phosphatidyltransferase